MNILQKLRPAETLHLLDAPTVRFERMVKLTLFDLILKGALQPKLVDGSTYIAAGPELLRYAARPHELPFLQFLRSYPESSQDINTLLKTVWKRGAPAFLTKLHESPGLQPYRIQSWWRRFLSGTGLNEQGHGDRDRANQEIAALQKDFPAAYAANPEQAMAIVTAIGGNIFLVPGIDLGILNTLQSMFPKHQEQQMRDQEDGDFTSSTMIYHGGAGCSTGCSTGTFDYKEAYDDIDTGCGADAGGCSADGGGDGGGDSGCSGCGGGCGGD